MVSARRLAALQGKCERAGREFASERSAPTEDAEESWRDVEMGNKETETGRRLKGKIKERGEV